MKELTSEILGIEVCCKYYITDINMINDRVLSNSDIATLFNVSAKTIRNIKNKKTWKHLSYLLK